MITPASSQEISDAPPAAFAAVSAPSSHPEPMIEPSEMNINDVRPTLRCRCPDSAAGFDRSVTKHLHFRLRPGRADPAMLRAVADPAIR